MDDPSLNQYEQQLYSVFKSFDINNEESLDEVAVNNLCDALQLEERGAALVDSLFEQRRAARVTFTQFRSGLLAVLGEPAAPPATAPALPSDDRELAPRFVLGAKEYGRRSRPPLASEPRASPRAASASRLEGDGDDRRPRFRRSASAMERRELECEPTLEHGRRIGREEALGLCRSLHMHSIDRRLVERIFDDSATPDTTVGEFFDRLNASLASSADADETGDDAEPALAGDRVVDAWEAAGVRRPRRLLAELGCAGAAVRPARLERALDEELRAVETPLDERGVLLAAALAVSRMRAADAARRRDLAAAERDKLRADVAEANERARLLALEVDESHSRIENELKANLKRAEARLAEETRRAVAEVTAEREQASEARRALEAEAAQLREAKARLSAQGEAQARHVEVLEARAAGAEERAVAAERELGSLGARLRAAEDAREESARAAQSAAALEARLAEAQLELQRLRDRADELAAALEARPPPAAAPPAPGDLSAELGCLFISHDDRDEPVIENCTTFNIVEQPTMAEPSAAAELSAAAEADTQTEPALHDDSAPVDEEEDEKQKLTELVKELEGALDAMRAEYEACEEYWGGKLAAERAAHDAEARAAAERLADLVARIHAFERRLAPPPALPVIAEAAALEAQVADLEEEFARYRREARARLAAQAARAARAERRPAAPAPAPELAARCARAEGAVRRLQARLAAADLLVKELYVENCQLAHARPLPL